MGIEIGICDCKNCSPLTHASGSARGYDSGEESARGRLAGEEPIEERRRDVPLLEVGVVKDTFVQGDGGLNAFDDEFVEGAAHAGHGFLAISSMRNQLGNHGIIVWNHNRA